MWVVGAGFSFKKKVAIFFELKPKVGVGKLYDEQRWSCKMLGEEETPTTIPGLFGDFPDPFPS